MTDRSRLSPQTLALPQMSNRLKVDQGLMIFSLANPKCTFLDLFFESFDCRRVEFYTMCRRSSLVIPFCLSLAEFAARHHPFFFLPPWQGRTVLDVCTPAVSLPQVWPTNFPPR